MNVQNLGKKIVNIGSLALVPGDTKPLPDDFVGNPSVVFLAERGVLKLMENDSQPLAVGHVSAPAEELPKEEPPKDGDNKRRRG